LKRLVIFALLLTFISTAATCRRRSSDAVTVALPEKFTAFDTITTSSSDAAAERVKNLMFNSLVRKNDDFDYVGELASDFTASPDGTAITFKLRDGIKFHNGKAFTSADVKYTFDQLFSSNGYKAGAFFDTVPDTSADAKTQPAAGNTTNSNAAAPAKPKTKRVAHITSITAPDEHTVVFGISRASLKNQLLANLVAVPIIADGTAAQQKDSPMGTGPFKFVSFDASQNIVELAANPDYWEGAPKVPKLRLKTITDANSLQAELATGGVDIAPNPNNISADTLKNMSSASNLKVVQSDGSNIQYLVLNAQAPPLNNVKIRQAIAYAIDKQKIVSDLLFNQAKLADSILPPQSYAYTPGTKYSYDPEKAKQLLQEAGYKNEPIILKYGSGNLAVNQYSQVIQTALTAVGLNVQIETLEVNTIRGQLAQGQFNMYTGVWVGGNTDPMFLRDLFNSAKIPNDIVPCCNRGRYSNAEVDQETNDAFNSTDRERSKELYIKAWSKISEDVPLVPLWYPANMIVANKRIDNIKINPSGDWGFLKDVTVTN